MEFNIGNKIYLSIEDKEYVVSNKKGNIIVLVDYKEKEWIEVDESLLKQIIEDNLSKEEVEGFL